MISAGQQLLSGRHQCPADVVEPKCVELQRVCTILSQRLERRLHMLTKCRELMERIDKVHPARVSDLSALLSVKELILC